ncbi:hypothetical protein K493DRAFT_316832 [Basidiobolus meristosporus CBS 931.73]|uniref:Uncharacterized protein n=1 Tax=Basidiobolus meristosporus CBS 931.73 TaxID=1314790 RepID=A0A1Y1Y1Z7_9FUNG|nr:hypothetical protein K493DRAFT_316832 [Basidiobolus meristosporus CBS 931.73]|eukprot:ORX92041.1 hypothetical protein K493DRAFT_316832 [Basidiobolus meristosporus CBS 931.73]
MSVLFFKFVFFCASFVFCSILIYGLAQHVLPANTRVLVSHPLLVCISGLFASYVVLRFWWQLLAAFGALIGTLAGMATTLASKRLVRKGRRLRLVIILLSGCAGVGFVYFLDNIRGMLALATYSAERQFTSILEFSIMLAFGTMKVVGNAILVTFGHVVQGMAALITHLIRALFHSALGACAMVLRYIVGSGRFIYYLASQILTLSNCLIERLAVVTLHLVVIYQTVLTD